MMDREVRMLEEQASHGRIKDIPRLMVVVVEALLEVGVVPVRRHRMELHLMARMVEGGKDL
jgi:hypothetical protein